MKLTKHFPVFIAALVSITASHWAHAALPMVSPRDIFSGDQTQSPYDKIKNLYDSANPMQLNLFLTIGDPEIGKWSCTTVSPTTTVEEVKPGIGFPVFAEAKITTVPAVSSTGPLFPGTPAQTKKVQMIVYVRNSQIVSNEELAKSYTENKTQLITTPEITQITADSLGTYQETFRALNYMLFVKSEAKTSNGPQIYYSYCYKK